MMVLLMLGACSNTGVVKNSPLFPATEDDPYATIYFIREVVRTRMPVSEEAVTIEINDQELLKLSMGDYTMVRILPTEGTVTVKNLAMYTDKLEPIEMTGSNTFNFASGQTNFILLKTINEEFRGVYYEPVRIEFNEAREISRYLAPRGMARKYPIKKL
jgi:hypothetical protein